MALLAVIYAVPPVPWVACMMSKCKYNYSIFIWSIHKRKRKVLEEHSPSFFPMLMSLLDGTRGRVQWHLQRQ
jgi:hypothetical protein